MKLPEKFYVTRNYRGTEEVLGFMVVADAEHTKSFQKKKETADSWARNSKVAPIYVDNIPRTGFQIVTNVSRYSTSNVVWRVCHPEGFEFEITSDNFMDLIQTSTIIEGAIQEELFFTENKKLVSSKTKLFANLIKQEEKNEQQKELISAFVEGDRFKLGGEYAESHTDEYLYCGSYHMLVMNKNKELSIPEKSSKKEVIMNLTTGKMFIRNKISDREIVKTGHTAIDREHVINKLNTEQRDFTQPSKYSYDILSDDYVLAVCGDKKSFKRDDCVIEYENVDPLTIHRELHNYFAYVKNNDTLMRVFGASRNTTGYYSSYDRSPEENWSKANHMFSYKAEINDKGHLSVDVDLSTHKAFAGWRAESPFSGFGYRNSDKPQLVFSNIPETIMVGRLTLAK